MVEFIFFGLGPLLFFCYAICSIFGWYILLVPLYLIVYLFFKIITYKKPITYPIIPNRCD